MGRHKRFGSKVNFDDLSRDQLKRLAHRAVKALDAGQIAYIELYPHARFELRKRDDGYYELHDWDRQTIVWMGPDKRSAINHLIDDELAHSKKH